MMNLLNEVVFRSIRYYYFWKRRLLYNRVSILIRNLYYYNYLKYHGVESEFGAVKLVGLPIIKKYPNSRIILGRNVTLVSTSKSDINVAGINHPVILATLAEGAIINIRDNCGLSGSAICAAKGITIGPASGVGVNSHIYDTDFHLKNGRFNSQKSISETESKAVEIGSNVWIAADVRILKGVKIGDGAIVGIGSVVTKDVPSNSLAVGVPAQIKYISTSQSQV